ncbi:MAG: ISAs1 family transposase [Pirellulales bacterium]|nr:ISAs1 family transposase [Pirellulales bacterium]
MRDTFSRVLALLDATKYQECIMRLATALHKAAGGKIVVIDGKTLRRSFGNAKGRGPIRLVSAWCSENRASLGQLAVDAKTNEITAIPELMELLDIPGPSPRSTRRAAYSLLPPRCASRMRTTC